jgi:hypothetical protein
VGVSVGIGIVVFEWVGVIVDVDDGMGIVVALPHPTKPDRSNNESNKMLASKMKFFLFISISFYSLIPPNGWRFRRLANYAGLGSFYLKLHRSTHHRKPKAEG